MRNPLRRYYGKGDLHFITFSCYGRRKFLGTPRARDCFVSTLAQVRSRFGFRLVGFVVMPEHVHLLISEPRKDNPSKVLQVLKQKVSGSLRSASPQGDGHAFWQRRFYDFNVWSMKKLKEKLEYMHGNPVKRKLVEHPADWPWSSWSYYERGERGLIAIDPWDDEEEPRQSPHP